MPEEMEKVVLKAGQLGWLNTVKSIGVILVIIGHLLYFSNLSFLNTLIYSFHMPLFFAISGFLYEYKDETNKAFIKRKCARLFIPAFLWYIITSPIYIIRADKSLQEIAVDLSLITGVVPFNEPCWFFFALFVVFVLIRIIGIEKLTQAGCVTVAFVLFSIGYFLYIYDVNLAFGMTRAIIGAGFFVVGYCLRHLYEAKRVISRKGLLICFSIWFLFGGILNEKVTMYGMQLDNYCFFVLSGIFGSLTLCGIIMRIYSHFDNKSSDRIRNRKAFIEKYPVDASIFIICSHYVPIKTYIVTMESYNLVYSWKYDVITIAFVMALIGVYYPLSRLVKEYLPILNGEPPRCSTRESAECS